MEAETIIITGGTDGIGKQIALRLASTNRRLILISRNPVKAEQTITEIQQAVADAQVTFWQADLSLMRETLRIADRIRNEIPVLDSLIHCAGVMLPKRTLTAEGLETVFAVQYLARWLLIRETLPSLQAADNPCVVTVSAGGAFPLRLGWRNLQGERFYHGALALIHESIANDMQVIEYQRRYPDIDFYCYGPFWVPGTQLMSTMPRYFQWIGDVMGRFIGYTPAQAGADIVDLLNQRPDSVLVGRKLKSAKVTRWKSNSENLERLWQVSESLTSQALGVD